VRTSRESRFRQYFIVVVACLGAPTLRRRRRMTASLRSLIRLVPCRLRSSVLDYVRRHAPDAKSDALFREVHFLWSTQRHLKQLNEKYFPQSGMTQAEVVAATAARVGFRMPKAADEDASKKQKCAPACCCRCCS
jgi:hypothetical protein